MEYQPDPHPAFQRNVLGTPLEHCCYDPQTGYLRDGYCTAVPDDQGKHTVCAEMTAEFLTFSQAVGNDLTTPAPQFGFPGLQPGDKWCLCLERWREAHAAGVAPPVDLEATNETVLEAIDIAILRAHALTQSP